MSLFVTSKWADHGAVAVNCHHWKLKSTKLIIMYGNDTAELCHPYILTRYIHTVLGDIYVRHSVLNIAHQQTDTVYGRFTCAWRQRAVDDSSENAK